MPYQDIDEEPTSEIPRQASPVEIWLHKIFIEDWSLKLLALAITVVLWLAVTGQNKPVTIRTGIQLNFVVPESLVISNDPPKTVDLILTGSRHKFDQLSNLVGTVDISDNRAGERVVRLSSTNVTIDQLPDGVRVEGFQPASLAVRLEPIVERELDVEVRLAGQPPEGFEVYEVRIDKNRVRVRGPASHITQLEKARTETIWVDGRRETFSVAKVAIDIPDQKIDLQDPVVEVSVTIGERRLEKSFEVATRSRNGQEVLPETTMVSIYGPQSDVERLQAEDLVVVVEFMPDGNVNTSVDLPVDLRERLTVRSIKSEKFSTVK